MAVVKDSFADDQWHYLYTYKSGQSGKLSRKELNLIFEGDKLVSASGDFKIPESLTGQALSDKDNNNNQPHPASQDFR